MSDVVVIQGGMYLADADYTPANEYDPWPLVLGSLGTDEVIKKWDHPPDWWCSHKGASRNGRFAAVALEPDSGSGIGERFRVGVIEVSNPDLRWVAEWSGHGTNTVRTIAVSDDGRYIAVGGWANGIALVDATEQKVLWNQRPPGEVSTGYVVFSSDGLTLYAGGSAGCVYALETRTGKVLRQWYTTPTGESVYAYRISCLTISPDDAWVAAGTGPTGDVYLINVDAEEKPRMFPHGLTTTMLVSFSPDSKRLATVTPGRIKVWSVQR